MKTLQYKVEYMMRFKPVWYTYETYYTKIEAIRAIDHAVKNHPTLTWRVLHGPFEKVVHTREPMPMLEET